MSVPERRPQIEVIPCRAKLPAAVWRALANSERPRYRPADLAVVEVEDGDEVVYMLTSARYRQLLDYIGELEGKGA
jgi:hypothetical protein